MPRLAKLFLRTLCAIVLKLPRARRTVPLIGPGGLTWWLDLRTLRVLPPLAGADEGEDEEPSEDEDPDSEEETETEEEEEDSEEDEDEEPNEDELPDAVKAILKKERKARRDAERKLRQATKAKPKPKPKAKPKDSETEDDEPAGPDAGTVKLRSANLLLALQAKGYDAARAKALAKLLDDVDYDDSDEPVALDDALADAEETYGTEMVAIKTAAKAKVKPPKTGGKDRGDDVPANLTASEVKAAEQAGKTPKEWSELKGVSNLADWEALQAKRRKAQQ